MHVQSNGIDIEKRKGKRAGQKDKERKQERVIGRDEGDRKEKGAWVDGERGRGERGERGRLEEDRGNANAGDGDTEIVTWEWSSSRI